MAPGLVRIGAVVAVALLASLLVVLNSRLGPVPPLGALLDPVDGLYRNARTSEQTAGSNASLALDGLSAETVVHIDERGVPHIFADDPLDAVRAMGYVVARDRLFQYDFIGRVASGRLSELLGPATIETDRFLRNTGMESGARLNAQRIRDEAGIEAAVIDAYCEGVNAYIDGLSTDDFPLEYRLLGGRPTRCDVLQVARLVQYMTFDLSYRSDEAAYGELRRRLGEEEYNRLYPEHSRLYVPIVGAEGAPPQSRASTSAAARTLRRMDNVAGGIAYAEGFREGKGSNNWAVSGSRSTTGHPILAGDMHLSLTLPAVWYEVHLVAEGMNTYGVTIPGAPLPVEAFNEHVGWTFTNTGSDQIDHYALTLDEDRRHYAYEGGWRPLERVVDTLRVAGREPVIDTLYYTHWGPVFMDEEQPIAIQWVAHKPNRTLRAVWAMNRATSYGEFERAIRYWDSPMQNILYAGRDGVIAIRSTGHLPIRQGGHGKGLLDGAASEGEWIGRVPFDELPHEVAPARGYATSTNQQPAPASYQHYLGHDWRSSYRSLRAAELLDQRHRHSTDDLMRYQADVVAMQHHLFLPLIDTLSGVSTRADSLRMRLRRWDGETSIDRPEPLILDEFLTILRTITWDEEVFDGVKRPNEATLYYLATEEPQSPWFDRTETPQVEVAADVLREALEATLDTLNSRYGPRPEDWTWGEHHKVVFRHLTGSEALRSLWRGPFAYPGFASTLSPAGDRMTTHSASWRVVVDFSTSPPAAHGIYPGGQSGDPFHPLYDRHLDDYLAFRYYRLQNDADIGRHAASASKTLRLHPSP